eukprot:COSAG01_NODE_67561_length_266_cov_1.844311_1_plen_35_part_01
MRLSRTCVLIIFGSILGKVTTTAKVGGGVVVGVQS